MPGRFSRANGASARLRSHQVQSFVVDDLARQRAVCVGAESLFVRKGIDEDTAAATCSRTATRWAMLPLLFSSRAWMRLRVSSTISLAPALYSMTRRK